MDSGLVHRKNRRKHPRVTCNETRFAAAIRLSDGTVRTFTVTSRNISLSGIAIMLDRYIDPGARCDIILPVGDIEKMGIQGVVVGCRQIALMLHEIGIQFDEPLSPEDMDSLSIVDR